MPVYERSTLVDAPLERVWKFHVRAAGLERVTPGWMHLRVESVRGPDGDPDPGELEAGATVEVSVRPFGVGPRRGWTTVIRECSRSEGAARFRDEMVDGPFPRWNHTHRFRADAGGTRVTDRVVYDLPGGPVGRLVGPLGVVGFEPMFRYRHRRTRVLLEDPDG